MEDNLKIERTMDNIRSRFGKAAISSGATVRNDMGIRLETSDDRDAKCLTLAIKLV